VEIQYLAEWNKKEPSKTWSGTTFYLREALMSRSDLVNIDGGPSGIRGLVNRLHRKVKPTYDPNFDIKFLTKRRRSLESKIKQTSPVLEIGDIIGGPNSFVYQDLTWDALNYLNESNRDSFLVSGFGHFDAKVMRDRTNYQRSVYSSGTKILSMSHWLTDFVNFKTPYTAYYVGAGLNAHPSDQIGAMRKQQVLFVGRDFERKGGHLVVKAFVEVLKALPDAQLIIAGPVARPKGIPDIPRIDFVGDVSYDYVSQLMSSSMVLCVPSKFEAYGLVFVEAMASGMSIIGRDAFEMPFFVDEGSGTTITSGDTDSEIKQLRDQMIAQLTNRNFILEANAKMEKIAHNHSWNLTADKIIEHMHSSRKL